MYAVAKFAATVVRVFLFLAANVNRIHLVRVERRHVSSETVSLYVNYQGDMTRI